MGEKDYVVQPLDELVSEPLELCEGTEPTPNEEDDYNKVYYPLLFLSIGYAAIKVCELITTQYHEILKISEVVSKAIENLP